MKTIWRNPVHLLAVGFGSGLAPRAPGTAGTAAAALLYLPLSLLPLWAYGLAVAAAAVAGIYLCDRACRDLYPGEKDPAAIVWDEFVGFWITLIGVPDGWHWLLAGFVLFRLLDILKPWPVKWADRRVGGGLGIMLDDIIAGIMSAVGLQAMSVLLS